MRIAWNFIGAIQGPKFLQIERAAVKIKTTAVRMFFAILYCILLIIIVKNDYANILCDLLNYF